jgi:Flavodoxin
MRARVVYESMFGNTQVVAQAVAEGLAKSLAVDLEEVGTAATDISADIDLLVVGGPTHAFGMSRERTRESAAEQAARGIVSAGEGTPRVARRADRRLARRRGCHIRYAHRQTPDAGIGRPRCREALATAGLPRARPGGELLRHRYIGPTRGW